MLFRKVFLSFLLAALSACTQPVSPQPDARPEPVVPAASGPDVGIAARTAVQNFVAVVKTVEPIAEDVCRDTAASGSNCDFRILVDDRPGVPANAFQTIDETGQPILAFTIPLIAQSRNRDEIAFVMAHEAAHHILGHLQRQQQNATVGAVVFGQLAGVIGSGNPEAVQAAQEFGATLGARSYSKNFELEADRLGTIIAARAGYDPVLGADFFFRIPDPGNRFLGTHPANADRVRAVRETAASLHGLSG